MPVPLFQNISEKDIKGKSRKAELVLVRHFIAYHLRENNKLSYPQIGKILGGRDHVTIMHAYTKVLEIVKKKEVVNNTNN